MSESGLDQIAAAGSASGPAPGPASTLADRDEQLNAEFRALTCQLCGSQVRVRKRSRDQTSVQWASDPAVRCPHLMRRHPTAAPVEGCPVLAATIRAAVQTGVIPSGTTPGRQ